MDIHHFSTPPIFSIGKKMKKKKHMKKYKNKNTNKNKNININIIPFKWSLKDPIFNICTGLLSDLFFTPSIKDIQKYIFNISSAPFKTSPDEWTNNSFWNPEKAEKICNTINIIQSYRRKFKILLHYWKYKHIKKNNEIDIYTGDIPKYPVIIVDWKTKQSWVFEANTLMKDITTRLQHHDGFFETPLAPRNPFTNVLLTGSQIISIWNQFSYIPLTQSTVFSAFRSARFNIKKFVVEQSLFLQLHALRITMKNQYQDRLLEFIQLAYDNELLHFSHQAFSYVIHIYPYNIIIQKWKYLCLRYYEAELCFFNNLDKKEQVQNKIWDQTILLLPFQKDIIEIRNKDLQIQSSPFSSTTTLFDIGRRTLVDIFYTYI